MSDIVERIRAKITRAKQHIVDFELALNAFYKTNPYGVRVDTDANTGKRTYRVDRVDCVPNPLTAIAADVVQNLRSPLDRIAYQLVLDARGGTKPDWKVYYPISGSAAAYKGTRGGTIKGVRQAVLDAIDATEPYPGGKGEILWRLNELNKPDKHELLIAAGSMTDGPDVWEMMRSVMSRTVPEAVADQMLLTTRQHLQIRVTPKMLHVGDELMIGHTTDPKMQHDPRFVAHVALNDTGITEPEPALKTFHDMANLVDDIVTSLGKFLP